MSDTPKLKIPTFHVDEHGKLIDITWRERTPRETALITEALKRAELQPQERQAPT